MSEPLRQAPRRYARLRMVAGRAAERICAALGGRAFYRRRHLAAGRLLVREEVARVRGLPAALEGFSVVQLSDLHGGSFLGPGDLGHLVERANALRPDVVALTGDFVTHRAREVDRIAGDLARLTARHGIFAVFGNHDDRGRDEAYIAAALPFARFLRNDCARVEVASGVDGAAIAFVGLEDLEEGRVVDLDAARADLRPGDVEVVLCHNPLGARAIARAGCGAILSGHTHAGQIDLPLARGIGPVHPGLRMLVGDTLLVVSRGIGATGAAAAHRRAGRDRAPEAVAPIRLRGAAPRRESPWMTHRL